MKGKLIVLYGINNLGKTTQSRLLVERLQAEGLRASYVKYALYDLEPSGPMINAYLRLGNPYQLSPREYQILHTLNRTQYDGELRSRLDSGEWIVAEDYVGTGIAWGMGAGVDRNFLEQLNSHLVREDMGFFFQGQRFLEARETNHKHETDDELMQRVAHSHEILAQYYNWIPIQANDTIEQIRDSVWNHVKTLL